MHGLERAFRPVKLFNLTHQTGTNYIDTCNSGVNLLSVTLQTDLCLDGESYSAFMRFWKVLLFF